MVFFKNDLQNLIHDLEFLHLHMILKYSLYPPQILKSTQTEFVDPQCQVLPSLYIVSLHVCLTPEPSFSDQGEYKRQKGHQTCSTTMQCCSSTSFLPIQGQSYQLSLLLNNKNVLYKGHKKTFFGMKIPSGNSADVILAK